MAYQPAPFMGRTPEEFQQYVLSELQDIAQSQSDPVEFFELEVLHKAPSKPRDGMLVCADGVHWQPLSAGGGFFGRFNGAWVKLNN